MLRTAALLALLSVGAAVLAPSHALPQFDPEVPDDSCQGMDTSTVKWVDAQTLGVRGRAFPNATRKSTWYSRFPAAAESVVRDAVWDLALDSAGMYVEFDVTSSSGARVFVNYTLLSPDTTMWHFPSTGVAGIDLYAWSDVNATWRWVGTTHVVKYPVSCNLLVEGTIASDVASATTRYRMHLPTYNSPVTLMVGVDQDATIVPTSTPTATAKPVVHYGTSICQGGVASRPGQAYTNIVSRALAEAGQPREVLNFGFSGNGIMETTVAQFLVQIDAAAFIIDCNPNMQGPQIAANAQPLIKYFRANGHATTPIIMSEGTTYGQSWYSETVHSGQAAKRTALKAAYDALVAAGDKNLHYLTGDQFWQIEENRFEQPTVGGTHPTDLGMVRMAHVWSTLLPTLLPKPDDESRAPDGIDVAATSGVSVVVPSPEAVRSHEGTHQPENLFGLDMPQLATGAGAAAVGRSVDSSTGVREARDASTTMVYTDLRELGVRGRWFNDTALYYDRLPASAKGVVDPAVYKLSQYSTGEYVRFTTAAPTIYVNYSTIISPEPLWHMPVTGTSGLDLFRYDSGNKTWRWVSTLTSFPSAAGSWHVTALATDLPPPSQRDGGASSYILYLPLRNAPMAGTSLGVPSGYTLAGGDGAAPPFRGTSSQASPASPGPVVWFGTSILQGGVASRPGNAFSNIVSRRIAWQINNFGFAGNGKMQPTTAQFLTQITDAAAIIVDCNWNMSPDTIAEKTQPLVKFFRANGHATTPIVLAEGTDAGDFWFLNGTQTVQAGKRAALKAAYDALVAAGDKNLHYVTGEQLFAAHVAEGDVLDTPTVGGTHPSDLGQYANADWWTQFLPTVLPE